ncbi:hypothetical protein M6B38_309665 [Iris pallida]|uniref:Uncharacterized protein n=1 Tax=Iris pallida TaxID=29817 RepID=A0AAX6HHE9_IRIPA|nr:hypothetical protein M6B38_309665 [Iris pallida]
MYFCSSSARVQFPQRSHVPVAESPPTKPHMKSLSEEEPLLLNGEVSPFNKKFLWKPISCKNC